MIASRWLLSCDQSRHHTSPEEKAEIQAKLDAQITERMTTVNAALQSRFEMVTNVIEAEMAQGDKFTKRARPSLVYFGMAVIAWNYCIVPLFGESVELPMEFWAAWGGTVAIWSVGRSTERVRGQVEKPGMADKILSVING